LVNTDTPLMSRRSTVMSPPEEFFDFETIKDAQACTTCRDESGAEP
jgi:hypothetical protein